MDCWPGRNVPPMPTLHFICYGNICRSPFAEHYARQRLAERPLLSWNVTSSGVGAVPGTPTPKPGLRVAASLGVPLEGHRARATTDTHPRRDDLLVAMDRQVFGTLAHNLSIPLSAVRGPGGAVLQLLMPALDPHATGSRLDVPDPMGQGQDAYDRSYRLLCQAVDALLDRLDAEGPPSVR